LEINISVPTIIRYVRNDDIISSELFVQQIPMKQSLVDMNLKTNDRLLNRAKHENSASTIRRSSSRLTMETILEETHECCTPDTFFCEISSSDFYSITPLVF
jgi:hypothetical protein